jgi:D-serine deaminase-like pyridoxal phosphate-dependent protein
VGSYPTLSPITCAVQGRTVVRLPRPSAGLLSVALDVAAGLRLHGFSPSPPLGLLARAAFATSPDFALYPGKFRDTATGRTAQTLSWIIPQLVRS